MKRKEFINKFNNDEYKANHYSSAVALEWSENDRKIVFIIMIFSDNYTIARGALKNGHLVGNKWREEIDKDEAIEALHDELPNEFNVLLTF